MISERVKLAREFFEIKEYPGNLFNLITSNKDYIEKYKILLFKQDLKENSSGFIAYTEDNFAIICINYKMNIGHQNFTIAHEIGHMFLHKGIAADDGSDIETNDSSKYEIEASDFAAELLYPKSCVKDDYKYIIQNRLLRSSGNLELADYINDICKKYCLSFKFAFYRVLHASGVPLYDVTRKYDKVTDSIGKLSERYFKYDYVYTEGHPYYKPYVLPLQVMENYVKDLTQKNEISFETGQAILERNNELEGCK